MGEKGRAKKSMLGMIGNKNRGVGDRNETRKRG